MIARALALSLCLGCASTPEVLACGTSEIAYDRNHFAVDQVDLLFVVDDSPSMSGARARVVSEIRDMVSVLASGDRDLDGERDFEPVRSLHVGVVSTDLGGSSEPEDARCAGAGRDGALVRGSTDGACEEHASGIFAFRADTGEHLGFAAAVGCAATLGEDGCGVEQPLEAVLRALSLSAPTGWTREGYLPPTFRDGSAGHGDGVNAGFLRPRSILSVVLVTDEDDCSTADVRGERDGADPLDPDPACAGRSLLPLARFVDGLIGLREEPHLIIFTLVAGIPEALVRSGASYDAILAAPTLQLVSDPARPGHLLPSCVDAEGRSATPPRRLIEAAQALERLRVRTSVQSICGASLMGAIDMTIERLSRTLVGPCFPRALEVDSLGRADCALDVTLGAAEGGYEITRCDQIEGAIRLPDLVEDVRGVPTVRQVCRLPALSREEAAMGRVGWFYDDGDPRLGSASMLAPGCEHNLEHSRAEFYGSEITGLCRTPGDGLPYCAEVTP